MTSPPVAILRIALFCVSLTIKLPAGSMAMPMGALSMAAVPLASRKPGPPLPATVVTTPCEVTLRMRWLAESATKLLPFWSTAMP